MAIVGNKSKPIYCKECNSRNSWQRLPAEDIKSDTGKVLWLRWVCRVCGHKTIYPKFNKEVN